MSPRIEMESGPGPAFALPRGIPALQVDPATTRRSLLFAAVGAGLVGATGGLFAGRTLGRATASASPVPAGAASTAAELRVAWARAVARGPLDELVAGHAAWMHFVGEHHAADPVLIGGVERLARVALAGTDADLLLLGPPLLRVFDRIPEPLRPHAIEAELRQRTARLQPRRGGR